MSTKRYAMERDEAIRMLDLVDTRTNKIQLEQQLNEEFEFGTTTTPVQQTHQLTKVLNQLNNPIFNHTTYQQLAATTKGKCKK